MELYISAIDYCSPDTGIGFLVSPAFDFWIAIHIEGRITSGKNDYAGSLFDLEISLLCRSRTENVERPF